MARPKKPPRDASQQQTPFGRVLIDYMWNQRDPMEPPLTTGQLAVRVGVQRSTISNWISGRFVPPLDTVFEVLARLHIPLQRLADAYRELGMQAPELLQPDTGPQPRSFISPSSAEQRARATSVRDEWDEMITRTASALRDAGLDPDTIAAVIEHIRDRQANRQPYQQHILAEHTPPYRPATGSSSVATGAGEAEDADEADDPSATERRERRSPRRRTPSSPQG